MANKKISELPELTTTQDEDVLPIVDSSTNTTKKITISNLIPVDSVTSVNGETGDVVLDKTDIGLSNVDNTSDANKPISTATQTALDAKQATLVSGTNIKTINSTSLLGSGDIEIETDIAPITVDGNSVSIAKDPTATTQDTAVIQSSDTNAGIAIVPNGTGAITARVPDGTATGGNARGANAVDLQMVRTSSNQIAQGQETSILGGRNNRITGSGRQGAIVTGESNFMNGAYNIIGGGHSNTIALPAAYGFIGSGQSNQVTSQHSTISGGQNNTASTGTHATVVGGQSNTSSGQYSVSGGNGNTASGSSSVALGSSNNSTNNYAFTHGLSNTVSGQVSAAFGRDCTITANYGYAFGRGNSVLNQSGLALGYYNTANAFMAIAMGYEAQGRISRSFNFSSGKISSVGDAQFTELTRAKEDTLTSGATTTITDEIILVEGSNNAWNVTVKYVAVVESITGTATGVSVGDTKMETLTIGYKEISSVMSTVGSINILSTNEDASMNTSSFSITTGTSGDMQLDFTAPTFAGGGSVTMRVVAKVEITSVKF